MSGNAGPACTHVAVVLDAALVSVRGIFVGTGGNVSITDNKGTTLIYKNVASGSLIPIEAVKVTTSGTTAADMIALQG